MKQVMYLKDNDPRFKWLSWRVGFFIGVLGLIILILLFVLGERQGLFTNKDQIHFVAESGAGLKPGMQVRLSGFRIGVADRVELNEEAKVDVTLLIEQQYMKWIKEDSIAILQQEGLIGDHYIEIAGGTPKAKRLQEGGVLMFAPALGIADIAQNLSNRTLPMIDSVQQTFDYVNDPKGDIRLMFTNVQQLTADLRETREKLDQLLARVDGVVNVEARSTLRSADQALQRADSVAAELNSKMSPVLSGAASIVVSANTAAQDASATMSIIKKTVEQSAPTIPGMLRNTDELVYGGRQTLDGLKTTWPLNSVLTPMPLDVPIPESRR